MSFPKYPASKPADPRWLGDIPSTWSVQKFRHLFKESSEKIEAEVFREMLSVSGYRGIELKEYDDDNRRRRDEDLIGYRIVRSGQLVVNTMWLNYAGLGFSSLDGHVSPAYRAYWLKSDENSRFLHYLLRSEFYVKRYTRLLTGVRPNSLQMSRDNMMSFPVILPPISDQVAIATFLDRETAKIDALIAEQQRLIELLQEKRQAVISYAVTKGLNPDAPMKDSGVDWLGEVPEHWEVKPIGYLTKMLSYGFTNPMPTADDGPYMLTANDIDYGLVRYESSRRTTLDAFNTLLTGKSRPSEGDILITKDGSLGRVAVHDGRMACINQSVAVMRVKEEHAIPDFAATCLMGGIYQDRMLYEAGGTTIKHIYISRLAKMPLAFPDVAEQAELLKSLRKRLSQADELVEQARTAVNLLLERRSALISAAVTGQIDVRGLVPAAAAA